MAINKTTLQQILDTVQELHNLEQIVTREAVREATEEEIGRGTAGTGFFRIEPMAPGNETLH